MPDKFTPLSFATLPVRDGSLSSATLASASPAPASVTVFRSLAASANVNAVPADSNCAKPVVTLQRNPSGIVTSIRVQCGCGQVSELNCSY